MTITVGMCRPCPECGLLIDTKRLGEPCTAHLPPNPCDGFLRFPCELPMGHEGPHTNAHDGDWVEHNRSTRTGGQ